MSAHEEEGYLRRARELGAAGYCPKSAADQLALSVKSVESYRARGMEKLALSSRAALVRYAMRQGWLTP